MPICVIGYGEINRKKLPACCEMTTSVYRQTISNMNADTCDVKSLLAALTVQTYDTLYVTHLLNNLNEVNSWRMPLPQHSRTHASMHTCTDNPTTYNVYGSI